ncbi:hypothetical protein BSP75_17850 [Aeromonas sp. YN13HZO-058]|nr:hypothetical protein BSP75_17850 [Aeromonas sp. YN13HZO-058]
MCGIDQTIHPVASDTMQTVEGIFSPTAARFRLLATGKSWRHGSYRQGIRPRFDMLFSGNATRM